MPVIGTFTLAQPLVVNPSVPAKTLPEFIAYAKANPGKINYASFGIGSAPNMSGELLKMMAGIDLVHVPYRASPVAGSAQRAGSGVFRTHADHHSLVQSGKLRALAVTSAKRSATLPEVPAVAELLPGFEANIWHGIGAPKGTPKEIIATLNKEINVILAAPQIKEKFANIGGTALGGTPEEYGKFVAGEIEKWSKVIKAANIKPVAEH